MSSIWDQILSGMFDFFDKKYNKYIPKMTVFSVINRLSIIFWKIHFFLILRRYDRSKKFRSLLKKIRENDPFLALQVILTPQKQFIHRRTRIIGCQTNFSPLTVWINIVNVIFNNKCLTSSNKIVAISKILGTISSEIQVNVWHGVIANR